jgi:hypothetical protein
MTELTLKTADEHEWSQALTRLNAGQFLFQSWPWHSVLQQAYGLTIEHYLASDGQGAVKGALAVAPVRLPHESKYVSLPFSDFAGPVAVDDAALWATVQAFKKSKGEPPLIIRLCGNESLWQRDGAVVIREGYVHRIDLTQSEAQLRSKQSKGFIAAVNQAKRLNVEVRFDSSPEAFRRFWSIHAKLRRAKFQEIPQPIRFFNLLQEQFARQGKGGIVEAWQEGRCIAGILYLIAGDWVYYKFASSTLEALSCRPNNLLLWRSMLEFRSRGLRAFDMGLIGSSEDYAGLRHFKRSCGADEFPLRFLFFNRNAADPAAAASWRSFLQGLTQTIAQDAELSEASVDQLSSVIYRWLI